MFSVVVKMWLLILFLLTIIFLSAAFVRHKYSFWADQNVVFIKPTFPYGNVQGGGKTRSLTDILKDIYDGQMLSKNLHKFMGIYVFLQPVLLVLDIDFVKTILVNDFQYFHDRGIYHNERDDPLSGHLFAIEGDRWKNIRHKLTPTFTSGKMKMMFPTIVTVGKELEKTVLANLQLKTNIDIKDLLARFTTDVIGTCAFGIECNSLNNPEAEFRIYGKKIIDPSVNFKKILTGQFKNLSKRLRLTITSKEVEAFFMTAVRQTIEYREKNNIQRTDFMNLLIEMKNHKDPSNRLSVEEIAAQSLAFFFAGFETSATAVSLVLYELAQNQTLQHKARACVLEVLAKHGDQMTYEAIKEMDYISQCIKESLRKYSPFRNLIRTVTKDYKIPNTSIILPKDMLVVIPTHAIHHDPKFYEDPDTYNPERFSSDNEAKRNPFSFLAFGNGPRNCIGQRFGMMQARIGLAVLIKSFNFEVSDETKIPLKFSTRTPILSIENKMCLRVTRLKKVV